MLPVPICQVSEFLLDCLGKYAIRVHSKGAGTQVAWWTPRPPKRPRGTPMSVALELSQNATTRAGPPTSPTQETGAFYCLVESGSYNNGGKKVTRTTDSQLQDQVFVKTEIWAPVWAVQLVPLLFASFFPSFVGDERWSQWCGLVRRGRGGDGVLGNNVHWLCLWPTFVPLLSTSWSHLPSLSLLFITHCPHGAGEMLIVN